MEKTLKPLNNYEDMKDAIESGMVEQAMEYVLNCNDNNMDCKESKVNAQYLLDCLKSGESVLPVFED